MFFFAHHKSFLFQLNMNYWLILTPIISAFTGWVTTWVAVKMLFHPRKPVNIFGFKLQGIFPKNQHEIAIKLGQVVSKELLSFEEIEQKITSSDNLEKLKPEIEAHIDNFLRNKLKDVFPMLSMFIGEKTIIQLKDAFLMELQSLFPVLMKSYMNKLQHDLGLEKIVFVKEREVFKPRKITSGISTNGWLEIKQGISSTDEVAMNAQYLVDSESFIKSK